MTARSSKADWTARMRALGLYLVVVVPAHLVWEILHLPLYTIWAARLEERAYAVAHCTAGDAIISAGTLAIALVLGGKSGWPVVRFWPVAFLTGVFGLGYTAFSEWLNVVVRGAWAYAESMPVIPTFGFELGIAPVLQWIAVPSVGFAVLRWVAQRHREKLGAL